MGCNARKKCNKYVAFYDDTTFQVPILSPKHVLFFICFVLILLILKHQTMYEVLEASINLKRLFVQRIIDQNKRTSINLEGVSLVPLRVADVISGSMFSV